MSTTLALEIIGGPLDGYLYKLDQDKVTIGRSNENDFSLKHDLSISGFHGEIYKDEGDNSAFKSISSTSKTIFSDNILNKQNDHILKNGQIIVIGNTIIEVCIIEDEFHVDNEVDVDFIKEFICQKLKIQYSSPFFDSSLLFNKVLEKYSNQNTENYSCVSNFNSNNFHILFPFLEENQIRLHQTGFRIKNSATIVAPRVQRILKILDRADKDDIEFKEICQSFLYEGKSIVARFMLNDQLFMKHFGVIFPSVDTCKKNIENIKAYIKRFIENTSFQYKDGFLNNLGLGYQDISGNNKQFKYMLDLLLLVNHSIMNAYEEYGHALYEEFRKNKHFNETKRDKLLQEYLNSAVDNIFEKVKND